MKFVDTVAIGGMRETRDGYMVGEVRCARTGVQQYLGAEMGMDAETVGVYRPEETVFDKASLSTFVGKPVTLSHPSEAVTAANWKQYAVGDIGEDIARDGEYVRVPIKLMDAGVIDAIKAGTREISMGYTCGIEARDGIAPDGTPYQSVQTGPLTINHLAIVPRARGGSALRIGDAAEWGAAPVTGADALPKQKGKDMPETMQRVAIDGLTIETTDQGAEALAKLQKQMTDAKAAHESAKATADADHAKAIAAKDAEIAKRDAEIDALKAKVLDGAALDKAVADRADLLAKAKAIAPDVKTDGLSDADIRKAVVTARLGDAVNGKADAYIDARFDILAEDAEASGGLRTALTQSQAVNANDAKARYEAALDKSIADLNAHRKVG